MAAMIMMIPWARWISSQAALLLKMSVLIIQNLHGMSMTGLEVEGKEDQTQKEET